MKFLLLFLVKKLFLLFLLIVLFLFLLNKELFLVVLFKKLLLEFLINLLLDCVLINCEVKELLVIGIAGLEVKFGFKGKLRIEKLKELLFKVLI